MEPASNSAGNWRRIAAVLLALAINGGCAGLRDETSTTIYESIPPAKTVAAFQPQGLPTAARAGNATKSTSEYVAPQPGNDKLDGKTQQRESRPEPAPQVAETRSREGVPDHVGSDAELLPIDLATALRLADENSPTVNLARERVREAYAHLQQAEVLWMPTLQGGPAYQRHDGQLQRSTGEVIQVSKSNLFIGGGAEARFDFSDAYFGPLIARRLTQAEIENSRAVTNNIQLEVASTYLDLMQVYAALEINADTLARAVELARLAEEADRAGVSKTKADPNRARTEMHLRREERITLEGQAAAVAARLAQLLYLQPAIDLRPVDPAVVPVALVPANLPLGELIATALLNRPELASNRALVEAALERWRQARYSPLIPKIDLAYYAGDFGGGKHAILSQFDGRGDGLAQMTWQLQNLGFGDVAYARQRESQYNQAMFHIQEVEAQIGAEVSAAAKQVQARQRALASAQEAVRQAEEMWRKLEVMARELGGPLRQWDELEPLLALQALAQVRSLYLTQVIEYNRAQFRLYVAMGQPPVESLSHAASLPVDVPVVPKTYEPPTKKPAKDQPE